MFYCFIERTEESKIKEKIEVCLKRKRKSERGLEVKERNRRVKV